MQNVNNNDNNPITPFAITNWRDIRKRFGIKQKNRRGHMYIIGKTGTGKSTLVENMVISDIKNGNGIALIDPHGDLAENVLNFIPQSRVKDVIYFNPADMEYPIAFNPLKSVNPEYHHLVAAGLVSVFKKIWSEFWGPRLEHILRYSILTILEYQNTPEGKAGKTGTLLDIPRILTNKEFRQAVIEKISNEQVKEFWISEFDTYSAWLRSQAISPILNKIGQFLSTTPIRNIVGQKENTFDVRDVMDEGKILIVNLSKGKIGEDNCALLGAMIVTEIQLAALSRADMPENKRKAFYLFVDEIHNFLTLSFADILSECRKYGLNLTLAHQYIEQLDEKMRAAIFGNVGTIISFRVGVTDAQYIAREFYPVFKETDLVNLPNHHIYLKLMIDGVTSEAFSAVTLPPPERRRSYKDKIIKLLREKYGRPRKEVEKRMVFNNDLEIKKQSRQGRLFG
jgi:type IV secretory pathway TraG/TraD family ATPase VirD4